MARSRVGERGWGPPLDEDHDYGEGYIDIEEASWQTNMLVLWATKTWQGLDETEAPLLRTSRHSLGRFVEALGVRSPDPLPGA